MTLVDRPWMTLLYIECRDLVMGRPELFSTTYRINLDWDSRFLRGHRDPGRRVRVLEAY